MSTPSPISGKTILVTEDDFLLALMIKDDLEEQGATVIGPIASCEETLRLLRDDVPLDAAILDINVLDGLIYEAADHLTDHGQPFVFCSSLNRSQIPSRFSGVPLFSKPIDMRRFFECVFH